MYVVTLSYHDVVWEDRDYRDVYTKKEFVYDEECNMVSLARQIKGREDSMERQLLNITSIKDEDKRIIAAILSSKGILRLEFIESRDCLEAFGSNENAAYRFLFCPTENKNGYLGFMVKMDKDAALQSDIRNSSSHIYAVKVLDKSTNDTKRMLVSIVQVIQEDLMSSNYKAKYGGKSSNTSTKGESKTDVHGKRTNLGIIMGINGELLNSYNESSFTKEYMNDVCEEFEYTYTGGVLKLNDTPPYDMTKYRL